MQLTTWIIALSLGALGTNEPTSWQQDYFAAVRAARSADKPILAIFSDKDVAKDRTERLATLEKSATKFVLLYANKNTENGRKLFETFGIESNNAVVVVERGIEWQFCRYERDLANAEINTVIALANSAKGKPTTDILTGTSLTEPNQPSQQTSFYVQPSNCST